MLAQCAVYSPVSICPSVHLSVTNWCPVKVAKLIVMQTTFQLGHPQGNAKYKWGRKNLQLYINNWLYLENGTGWVHSFYER